MGGIIIFHYLTFLVKKCSNNIFYTKLSDLEMVVFTAEPRNACAVHTNVTKFHQFVNKLKRHKSLKDIPDEYRV